MRPVFPLIVQNYMPSSLPRNAGTIASAERSDTNGLRDEKLQQQFITSGFEPPPDQVLIGATMGR